MTLYLRLQHTLDTVWALWLAVRVLGGAMFVIGLKLLGWA